MLTIFRNWKLRRSLVAAGRSRRHDPRGGGRENVNPTEISPILQEPFIVKLKQPLRRSPTLRGEIEQIRRPQRAAKVLQHRSVVCIARWIVAQNAISDVFQSEHERWNLAATEPPFRPCSELATTLSASAGQVQPALLATAAAPDADIPEPRLRGFREFRTKLPMKRGSNQMRRTKKACYLSRRSEEALLGKAVARRHVWPLPPTMLDLEIASMKVVTDSENERSELIEFDEDQVSTMEMIRRYHALPWVEYAEPQHIILPLEPRAGDFSTPMDRGGYHLDITMLPSLGY